MTLGFELGILWAVLAALGAWAVYTLVRTIARWIGRTVATVFFGDREGGRK